MLYHLIFICSIWNQDEAERERDFENLQNTQSYPRPAKKWITVCGGIGGGQTPTATPFCLPNPPQLNMSTWLGYQKEIVKIIIL